jgi:hypothetical protein
MSVHGNSKGASGEDQNEGSTGHDLILSGMNRRTIAARISSAIDPAVRPSAGLTVRVLRAVTPTTGRHDGLPSNNRREIAKSVPAKISNAPTAPMGNIENSAAA